MEQIAEILRKHKLWLDGEDGGEKADLRGANLRGADLRGANLRGADLRGADLRGADFSGADFSGANLSGADLRRADLIGANLSVADLRRADLIGALRIVRIDCGGWSICIDPEKTSIGCQTHDNEKWLNLSADDKEIKEMASSASVWWRDRGDFIKAAIRYAMDCPVYAKQKDAKQ